MKGWWGWVLSELLVSLFADNSMFKYDYRKSQKLDVYSGGCRFE